MAMTGIDIKDGGNLFRPIVKTKKGEQLRREGKLSYTRMRELMRQKLEEIGLHVDSYGLHSFRAGGATAAANRGIPDRAFKKHGRWKSETAKNGYVQDSLKYRLAASQAIGL